MFYRYSVLPKGAPVPHTIGFSMVELLVSIGIVVLVLSIVVTRQQSFNSAVLLGGQAYEIALAMREVQLSAISAASDGSGEFRSVQGIYFDRTDNQEYRLFRDANGNQFFDTGEDIGFSGVVDGRFELRGIQSGGVDIASDQLAVVFKRPNFDAVFVTDDVGSILNVTAITLIIGLRGGGSGVCGEDIREIEIRSTGQIAVVEC